MQELAVMYACNAAGAGEEMRRANGDHVCDMSHKRDFVFKIGTPGHERPCMKASDGM
jgi:hypothetical protein